MAEVSARNVMHPVEVLHDEWVAQAELSHVTCAFLIGKFGEAFGAEDRNQGSPGRMRITTNTTMDTPTTVSAPKARRRAT